MRGFEFFARVFANAEIDALNRSDLAGVDVWAAGMVDHICSLGLPELCANKTGLTLKSDLSEARCRILIALIRICGMLKAMDGTPQPQISNDFIVHTAPESARSENNASNAPARTLEQLGKGEHATVVSINASQAFGSLDGLVTRRLWELGFLPGAQISVVGFGLLRRDPIAVKIGGTKFALRRAEAQKILVSAAKSESEQAR